MTLSELCIRRPVMTTLMTASIIAFGVFGFRLLPVSALPKVDFPTIAVTATLPGASADSMAASVAGPIERQLSTIAGISSMSSTSSQGTTAIVIQFDLNRNIDAAALDVQTALTIAQRRLPVEMTTPPSFRKVNPADFPVLFVVLRSPTLPLSAVHEYGDITIGQTLSQIPGVAQVNIYGAQKFAIRVQADPQAAAARGLSLEDIRAAVARANSSTPVGTLNGPKQDVALQASGQLDKAADYRQIVVAWRNGSPVKLDEVARIYDSVENDKIASWLNDERSIVLGIQKQPDANTVAVVDSVLAKLPTLRAQIPPSVDVSVLMDRSISIRQAVSDVEEPLLIAVAIVVSGFVSLTLTPMLCARLLRAHDETRRPNIVLRVFERVFDSWLRAYEWALDRVLAKKFATLLVTLATLGGTVYLYMIVPKGFFPQEDTGFLIGVTEAATDTSFEAMKVRQQALVDVLKSDPAIDYINCTVGLGGPNPTAM